MTNNVEMKGTAFLLPDKIVIETLNKKNEGTWYSTGMVTILSVNVSDIELGQCILNHLYKSKDGDLSYELIRENWKLLIKEAGFKTEKSFLQNVKRVSLKIEGDKMIFEPFKIDISKKTFFRLPAEITEIRPLPENSQIGKEVRKSWTRIINDSISPGSL